MKEQFVTYEIALKLKELGFDEECFGFYKLTLGDNIPELHIVKCNYNSGKYITIPEDFHTDAPLWQQVIDWFREKYKLYINIEPDITKNWQFSISNLNDGLLFGSKSLFIQKGLNYKEIREQAILKAIELCKNK